MSLNTRMTDEQIAEATDEALRSGRTDILKLIYALRMIRDANRIKDPIAKASRYNIAVVSMHEGLEIALALGMKYRTSEPAETVGSALDQFEGSGQYEMLSMQCLDAYHSERKAILWKMKSGKRQLASAQSTIKKLEILHGRYREDPLKKHFDSIWNYWQDQAAILEQYSDQGQ